MKRITLILAGAMVAGLALTGCSSGSATNEPPVPTSAATDTNGNNAKLVIPSDVVGKNAQLADDELRKVGFVNIRYGAQGATAPDPAHYADWNVSAIEPPAGSTAQSNDNIVVTVVKK